MRRVRGALPHTPVKPFLQKGFDNPKKLWKIY